MYWEKQGLRVAAGTSGRRVPRNYGREGRRRRGAGAGVGAGIRYLGFSGLLVCPHRSSQSLGFGGYRFPAPPLGSWEAVEVGFLA